MERQKEILLVSPPSRMVNHYRPPLSLIHLGGYLKRKGLSVGIIDVPMKKVVRTKSFWKNLPKYILSVREEMIRQIRGTKSEFIGISCYSPELEEVKELIGIIKTFSKAKIIVGGIHPTLKPEDFNGIAIPVQGIGEKNAYKIITGNEETLDCYDDLCSPDYSMVDMGYYTNANPYAIRGVFVRATYFLAGIGCPSQCTFCVSKTLRSHFGFGQRRRPNRLLEDIVNVRDKYKIDGFYFMDDLFTIDKEYVREFCSLIKDNGLIWGCSSKVTTLDDETIGLMAESGCVQIDFGVERGSNESLQALKKGQTVEKIKEVFGLCKKHRIRTFANMLVNIPGETDRDFLDIEKLLRAIRPTIVSVNVFRGYAGVELPDNAPDAKTLAFVERTTKKYNGFWNNLQYDFIRRYFGIILFTERRLNYFKQLWCLIAEYFNQRFN